MLKFYKILVQESKIIFFIHGYEYNIPESPCYTYSNSILCIVTRFMSALLLYAGSSVFTKSASLPVKILYLQRKTTAVSTELPPLLLPQRFAYGAVESMIT